jgi:hypothetical protein
MSIIPAFGSIESVIQNDTLARVIHEALYPQTLYRSMAIPEVWPAGEGQTVLFSKKSLIPPNTRSRVPGKTNDPATVTYEHWRGTLRKKGDYIPTDMPSSGIAITSTWWENFHALGLQAGLSLDRIARNPLYRAYQAGQTMVDTFVGTTIHVPSLNGWAQSVAANGYPVATSATNPKRYLINGVFEGTASVVQVIPDDPAAEDDLLLPTGPGRLVLDQAPAITPSANDSLVATDASRIVRSGGGSSIDAINAGNILTMQDIRVAVQTLRTNSVQPCADGMYHVHLPPNAETALFRDNEFQRLNETRYNDDPYRSMAIGRTQGCLFFSNNQSPEFGTLEDVPFAGRPVAAGAARMSRDIGAEVRNANGIDIARTIIVGGGCLFEKWMPESRYMSEAGVQGKVGGWHVTANGIEIPMQRIRCILQAPTDVFQEVVNIAWSWSGDIIPATDRLGGRNEPERNRTPAHKRAVVIESAVSGGVLV